MAITVIKYGSELKTLCTILNTEGIVALDSLANLVSCITHRRINLLKGSIVNFRKELNRENKYLLKEIEQNLLNSEMMNTQFKAKPKNNRLRREFLDFCDFVK